MEGLVPFEPGEVAHALQQVQDFEEGLWKAREQIQRWADDVLIEHFQALQGQEVLSMCLRSLICHTLSERRGGNQGGIKAAAQQLGVSSSHAYKLSGIYDKILSRLDALYRVPASFYQVAYESSRAKGIDPVDALAFAEEKLDSGSLTARQFRAAIQSGLEEHRDPVLPSCDLCARFCAAPEGAELELSEEMENGEWLVLARGEGRGLRYCAELGVLESSLGDKAAQATHCEQFKRCGHSSTEPVAGAGSGTGGPGPASTQGGIA